MWKSRPWLTGKGGLGYLVRFAGTAGKNKHLAVTIPLGQGFEQGDRVFMRGMMYDGVEGIFITKTPPNAKQRG
jgi:hypothetical protein